MYFRFFAGQMVDRYGSYSKGQPTIGCGWTFVQSATSRQVPAASPV